MSAEKEIVNYWYNKRGYFTVNNIKSSNRDAGILALKFDKDVVDEVLHIEVSCSITNNISETTNLDKSISKIIKDKFEDKSVIEAVNNNIKQFSIQKNKIKKKLIIGAVPKSRKNQIISEFREKDVEVIEFNEVLCDIMEWLDTQYYKNDILRTLQLTKFLLLSEPSKLSKLLINDSFTSNSRQEFLSSILDKDKIMKEFRKTNMERLAAILKNSGLKPSELAKMIENNILNKKTRKLFLNSLMEHEKMRKIASKSIRIKKSEMPLYKYF